MDWNNIDWERLDRLVTGLGSPNERAALEAWFKAHPELQAVVAAMRAAGRPPLPDTPERQWDVRAAWQRLRRRMGRAPLQLFPSGGRLPLEPRAGFRNRGGLAAAAAVVLVVATSLVVVLRSHHGAAALREVATRRSQTAVLELPDGSRVMLGPASRLGLPVDAGALQGGGPRDVYLEGEAYLEVKHDIKRPFRVRTAAGVVEDVGTEFLVTAYPETHGMQVVVASGAVALYQPPPGPGAPSHTDSTGGRPLLMLARGDLAVLASTGVATVTRDVNLSPYMAWTEGNLAFDGARLADVVPVLERWYDVEIQLADSSLADRRLTARFRRESLSQVLELLALSLDVRVEHLDRSVLLAPGRRLRSAP